MQNSSSRNDILNRMVEHKALTHDGREWLTMALDPFHDDERTLAGYPDSDGSQTIVSLRKYQATISAPVGCVGNWDAHVFSLPVCNAQVHHKVTTNAPGHSEFTLPALAANSTFSMLNIRTNDSGTSLIASNPLVAHYEEKCLPAYGVKDLVLGNSRVVAVGYEIHNTTAEMHKQGTATTYRLPQYPTAASWWRRNSAGTEKGSNTGVKLLMPPEEVTQAMYLKGTRVWDAAEGVYAPLALDSSSNPLTPDAPFHQLLDKESFSVSTASFISEGSQNTANAAPIPSIHIPELSKTCPFDTTGTFLTGLSAETTLTITLRVYVERAPGWMDSDLAVLASPSASYDVKALELYAATVGIMPVATKVENNASGDWWRTTLKVLGNAAEVVGLGTAAILPGAPIIGKGVSQILNAIAAIEKKKTRKTQQQPVGMSDKKKLAEKIEKIDTSAKKGGRTARIRGGYA